MKTIKLAIVMLALMAVASAIAQSNPICPNTTRISFTSSTGSSTCISSSYDIYEDSLVWNYSEDRNDCWLGDVYRYEKEEYKALLDAICSLKVSIKPKENIMLGGGWDSYSFSVGDDCYLSFDEFASFEGESDELKDIIHRFIDEHRTEGELLFDKLRREPHKRGEFGTFKELPDELKKYSKRKGSWK